MGSEPRQRAGDSFWFPEELGERLVALRRKRGYTQQQLAAEMGRTGQGSRTIVCRLERGKFRSPSLRLLGDYLRGCRAGFDDVADILRKYTEQPTAAHQAGAAAVRAVVASLPPEVAREVAYYDAGVAEARERAGAPTAETGERSRHAWKMARAALMRRRLHTEMVRVLNARRVPTGVIVETWLQRHARKVWSILMTTRRRGQSRRSQLLAEEQERFTRMAAGDIPGSSIDIVQQATVAFYRKMERQCELDQLPPAPAATAERG
jgi:transcriptional regulator with XRE-family HTH domain